MVSFCVQFLSVRNQLGLLTPVRFYLLNFCLPVPLPVSSSLDEDADDPDDPRDSFSPLAELLPLAETPRERASVASLQLSESMPGCSKGT